MSKDLEKKSKKKENSADLAPSRSDKKGMGQYVLGFCLLLYTLFCALPVILVFIVAFTDEKAIARNGISFFPEIWSLEGMRAVLKYGSRLANSYGITVKNSMSCHSSALTRCHKLTHLFVTTSGAFAPDFLLYSTDHLMVCYKTHHVLIY